VEAIQAAAKWEIPDGGRCGSCDWLQWFSDQAPMRREISQLAREGKLNSAQLTYAGPRKPNEELFDTDADLYQIHNLGPDPARHTTTLGTPGEARGSWTRRSPATSGHWN